jgi:hypothetical protein
MNEFHTFYFFLVIVECSETVQKRYIKHNLINLNLKIFRVNQH